MGPTPPPLSAFVLWVGPRPLPAPRWALTVLGPLPTEGSKLSRTGCLLTPGEMLRTKPTRGRGRAALGADPAAWPLWEGGCA